MNPRLLASELKDIGCPFSCHYIDYKIELVYKKIDTQINPDVLQLTFYMDDKSSWQTTVKDLDYTHDMLASDYGAIFGLFLGLSLIDILVNLLGALRSLCLGGNSRLRRSYDLAKWFLVTGLIGLLIVLMFVTDFQKLDLFLPEDTSAPTDDSEFLNPNANSHRSMLNKSLTIIWGSDAYSGL